MKKCSLFVLIALLVLSTAACQSKPATPAIDTQATINAAVYATATAQASMNTTVQTMVAATLAAQPTATRAATTGAPTIAAQPTATPQPVATAKPATAAPTVNAVTMTEEELAALIDQAVNEAIAATTTASTTTTTYSADGALTTQEVAAMTAAVTAAQTEINQALALANSYYALYADVSTEMITVLKAIETDLNSMATSMNTMATSLQQINTTLSQGLTLAQSTITQLQTTANQAKTAAQNAQTKAKSWDSTVKTNLDKRGNEALAVKPNNIPTDWKGATQSVNTYIETVRNAVGDNKLTKGEISAVSLAGANAVAGLNSHGGGQFQGLSSAINTTTKQVARGETPKAKSSLGGLEQSARSLPSAPSIPSRK
ncbi:MAG: hypothetical protein HY868_22280 [Chloroflexi bacterium]|nr:hypothetical protein [Chloroflexota bacterium]